MFSGRSAPGLRAPCSRPPDSEYNSTYVNVCKQVFWKNLKKVCRPCKYSLLSIGKDPTREKKPASSSRPGRPDQLRGVKDLTGTGCSRDHLQHVDRIRSRTSAGILLYIEEQAEPKNSAEILKSSGPSRAVLDQMQQPERSSSRDQEQTRPDASRRSRTTRTGSGQADCKPNC